MDADAYNRIAELLTIVPWEKHKYTIMLKASVSPKRQECADHDHQFLSIMLFYRCKLPLYRCKCLPQLMKNTSRVTYTSRLTLAVMLSIPVTFVLHYKLWCLIITLHYQWQGWKISWYFRKYRKYPIFLIFSIFSIYLSSICTYIAEIIWNLLPNDSMCVCIAY